MAKFAARRVLPDSDRSWVPNAQNVLNAALNGEFPGRTPKLLKSEGRFGTRIRYLLMKQHIWVSGETRKPSEFVRLWIIEYSRQYFMAFRDIVKATTAFSTIGPESSVGNRFFPQ